MDEKKLLWKWNLLGCQTVTSKYVTNDHFFAKELILYTLIKRLNDDRETNSTLPGT